MKIKNGVVLIIVAILLITIAFAMFYVNHNFARPPAEVPREVPHQDNFPPADEPEPVHQSSATLAAVGDILIHSSIYRDAKTQDGFDFTPMFARVKPILSRADIAFANQETIIGGVKLGLSDYPRFNSPFEVGDALKDAGIDIVSMANNHTLDRGEAAIRNAIGHWNEIGMTYVGAYQSWEDRQSIRTIEKNGIVFSFLAYSYGTNGLPVPKGKEYLVNLIDLEQIKKDVTRARNISDVVVVSLHFGNEYHKMPDESQTQLVHALADAGVDIILGHHPHVLQPAQWIERDSGKRTFVIYSLGNFIAAQNGIDREIGGILQIKIVKTTKGDQTKIVLKNPQFIPTWAYKEHYRNYDIIPASQWNTDKFPILEKVLRELKTHMTQWIPDMEIITGDSF
ncbi:MAG: CapA family protein [Bacillaceae bacterium]|nr:CapA family protein [Bacillaceae bacterium]